MPNKFREPGHMDIKIQNNENTLIGTLRIKPNGILWRNANEKNGYRKASLEQFIEWNTASMLRFTATDRATKSTNTTSVDADTSTL